MLCAMLVVIVALGGACLQGDQEAACGLNVSPMCDRSKMNMPRAQINFIEIFLKVL